MSKGTIKHNNGYINSRKSIRSKYNNLKIILGGFYTISWLDKLRILYFARTEIIASLLQGIKDKEYRDLVANILVPNVKEISSH